MHGVFKYKYGNIPCIQVDVMYSQTAAIRWVKCILFLSIPNYTQFRMRENVYNSDDSYRFTCGISLLLVFSLHSVARNKRMLFGFIHYSLLRCGIQ